jgi:hypothetical protein
MSNLATITNNILADSGIDDINVVVTTGSYANPAWITSLAWTKITGAPSGIVTGTGTNNYLPKFTGTSTIGNSQVFDNGTNVGIGTATPQYLLTIGNAASGFTSVATIASSATGASVTNLLLQNTSGSETASTGVNLNFSGVSNWLGRINAQFVGGTGLGNADMTFWTPSGGTISERLRITSTGNLGLGVTPSAWGTSFGIKVIDTGSKGSFYSSDNDANVSFNQFFDGTNAVYKTTGTASRFALIGNEFQWRQAASGTAGNAISFTQAMTLTSGGNLLVGTSTNTTGFSRLVLNGGSGSESGIQVNYNASTFGGFALTTLSSAGGGMSVYTYTGNIGSESYSERARITSGGNLLVGTTTDAGFKLDVNGTGRFSGNVGVGTAPTSTDTLSIANTNARNELQFIGSEFTNIYSQTTSGIQFGITSSGNSAGIDFLTNNSIKLTIASTGAATFSSSVTAATDVTLNNGTLFVSAGSGTSYSGRLSTAYIFPWITTYLDSFAGAGWEGRLQFRTNSAGGAMNTQMTILNNGNIGIGTPSPEQKLHVEGNIQIGNQDSLTWAYDNGSFYNYITNFYNTTDGLTYRSGSWTGNTDMICHSFETHVGGWQKRLVINQNGNVGIGTSSPSDRLTVGAGSGIAIRTATNGTYGSLRFGTDNSTWFDAWAGIDSDWEGVGINVSNLRFYTSFGVRSERMRITSGGNVLIGTTTNLGSELNVNNTIRVGVAFGSQANITFGDSGTPYWTIGRPASSGNFSISSYALTAMTIIPTSGNVLIGTTTDVGAMLHVNGSVRTGAPSGGSAVNWRLGTARGGPVTSNATVRVEIDGVLVDLVARYV